MSRDGCVALPRGATGLSAVCDCGISCGLVCDLRSHFIVMLTCVFVRFFACVHAFVCVGLAVFYVSFHGSMSVLLLVLPLYSLLHLSEKYAMFQAHGESNNKSRVLSSLVFL